MSNMEPNVQAFLETRKIPYQLFTHPAVFTVAEAEEHCKNVPGMACKNLFLKDKAAGGFFLVTMPATKRLNIKALARTLGVKEFRFGTEEELWSVLKLKPGAVSPLGLINDTEKVTTFILDQEAWNADSINVHPNVNTASIELNRDALRQVVLSFGNPYRVLALE